MRTASTPTPLGPPNLWALSDSTSTCGQISRRSSQLAACTASVWSTAPRRAVAHERGDGGEVVDGADLVVHRHDRHDADVVGPAERLLERVEVDASPCRSSTATTVPPWRSTACSTAWCSAAGHTARPARAAHRAGDGGVVALGAAAREHDLAGPAADHGGDLVAGVVDGPAGVAGESGASRSGWRSARTEERQHRLDRRRPHRRRRRVVEVHRVRRHRPQATAAPSGASGATISGATSSPAPPDRRRARGGGADASRHRCGRSASRRRWCPCGRRPGRSPRSAGR